MPDAGGRLIALEGIHSAGLRDAVHDLLHYLNAPKSKSGFSLWDASGTFFELAQVQPRHDLPSVKTLLILYASDLAFRLRWEIQPALDEGYTVIAAPYVQTAFALGLAAQVSREWLQNLFDFAPRPAQSYLVAEGKRAQFWTPKKLGGFGEFGCSAYSALSPNITAADIHNRMRAWLHSQQKARRLRPCPA